MFVITRGFLSALTDTCGFASSTITALVINQVLTSIALVPLEAGDPWSIDPERTQVLTELTSPDETTWASSYSSAAITTSPSPTPWSIDPERTQELT
jgi:hypothetical protein